MPYEPLLDLRQTERGIRTIKEYFQTNLADALNLLRVSAPLFVLADTGVNGISVDHLVDVSVAKREVGNRVCIIGNIDPVGTLLLGTPEKVLKESRQCIEEAGQGGGFVLAPGCGVPPNSPPKNMAMMGEAVARYGRYPLSV